MRKNGAIALLERAKSFINIGWTRHSEAVTEDGAPVSPTNRKASRWDAKGALVAAAKGRKTKAKDVIKFIEDNVLFPENGDSIYTFNDYTARDRRYVTRLYNRAIKKLQS